MEVAILVLCTSMVIMMGFMVFDDVRNRLLKPKQKQSGNEDKLIDSTFRLTKIGEGVSRMWTKTTNELAEIVKNPANVVQQLNGVVEFMRKAPQYDLDSLTPRKHVRKPINPLADTDSKEELEI
jgi:hypothetical protein